MDCGGNNLFFLLLELGVLIFAVACAERWDGSGEPVPGGSGAEGGDGVNGGHACGHAPDRAAF